MALGGGRAVRLEWALKSLSDVAAVLRSRGRLSWSSGPECRSQLPCLSESLVQKEAEDPEHISAAARL